MRETFLRALWGKELTREPNMESHVPPQPPVKSKKETYPIAIRLELRDAYGRLSSENQGVTDH